MACCCGCRCRCRCGRRCRCRCRCHCCLPLMSRRRRRRKKTRQKRKRLFVDVVGAGGRIVHLSFVCSVCFVYFVYVTKAQDVVSSHHRLRTWMLRIVHCGCFSVVPQLQRLIGVGGVDSSVKVKNLSGEKRVDGVLWPQLHVLDHLRISAF